MEFTMIQIIITGVVLLFAGAILRSLVGRKGGEGFFSRIFQTNKDLDSTLDHVFLPALLVFMLVSFHDDLAGQSAGNVLAIFIAAFALYERVVTGKTLRDMQNGHGKGEADG